MHPTRRLRLETDYAAAERFVLASGDCVSLDRTEGSPPERYRFMLMLRSMTALEDKGPVFSRRHFIQVQMPAAYPAQAPVVTALSALVHPHVHRNGTFCLGGWNPGQPLDRLLERIVRVMSYEPRAINFQSVANPAAARWARENLDRLPL